LQQEIARRNEVSEKKIILRVGINLGDVLVDGTDLYGDGVNIAARLEGLAEPGAILLSNSAYEQVKNKTSFTFDDLGIRNVRNIAEPVRVYRIALGSRSIVSAPKVSEKPSIAVLPLTNMSGDPGQDYLAEGITEDIITELSRFRQIQVLSRNSSFRYSGKNADIVRVGRELNVQYVLEGSLRKIGDRVRITAQLIDASSGNHLWAERYDRKQDEIFDVQDQVVRNIVGTLVGRLQAAGVAKAKRKPPSSLTAYEYVLQADELSYADADAVSKARELYQKAIELDPDYARAYALLALNFSHQWMKDMSGSSSLLDQAHELAMKALELDENDPLCHEVIAWIELERGSHDLAEFYYEKARELNPNRAVTLAGQGDLFTYIGKPEEGLQLLREAKSLDPFFNPSWYWISVGICLFVCRRYDDAIACLTRVPYTQYSASAYLAASHAKSGRIEQARSKANEVLKLLPSFKTDVFVAKQSFKHAHEAEHLQEGLERAGLR
jgi:TolB-like protein/Tfp pilus assembly protein PilF